MYKTATFEGGGGKFSKQELSRVNFFSKNLEI